MTVERIAWRTTVLVALTVVAGCSWRPYAGVVRASSESYQAENTTVADDGTVTFRRGRLEVSLRPVSDDELNRQFGGGDLAADSRNPLTYGGVQDFYTGDRMQRFTVFLLKVKNYQHPKVRLDGDVVIETDNRRKYYGFSLDQLDRYFRAYTIGYRGNEYGVYKERRAVLAQTMFPRSDIFSGQEEEGYVLFEPLHDDVERMTVHVRDLVVRFNFRGEAEESIDARFAYEREVGRVFPDGRVELSQGGGR